MTTLNYTVKFHKTVLASFIGLCLSQSCLALEELTDQNLSDTTGEGIAILPQDTYLVFRGAGANESKATLFSDRTKDTGYIHYIPVGPLTQTAQDTNKDGVVNGSDHSVGKADLYVYGLALSKADGNSNSRIASSEAAAKISSWGTAANPWVLRVGTQDNVPTFTPDSTTPNKDVGSVSFLALEAPLYEYTYNSSGALVTSPDPAGADAYHLKLGLWADAFVLDQSKAEGDTALYNLGQMYGGASDPNRANRLRLQAIWNDFSLNGSRIQLFQTLNGASNSNGLSAFYNNTLGLSGVLRFNSGDSRGLTATSLNMSRVLRLSTQECGAGSLSGSCSTNTPQGNLVSPAITAGSLAPVFDSYEGLFIYNLNTNLILGSTYQPLIIGSDGKNFSLEIARIPNKADIYNKIYTDYDNPQSTTYLGSTCNVYQCGKSTLAGYQGLNATHSSISIGSTVYDPAKNLISADKSASAVGVSFGSGPSAVNLGSAAIDGMLIQHMKITTKGL